MLNISRAAFVFLSLLMLMPQAIAANGEKTVIQLIPQGGSKIEVPLSIALMSTTLKNILGDILQAEAVPEIPLPGISRENLEVLIDTLTSVKETKATDAKLYKTIILSSIEKYFPWKQIYATPYTYHIIDFFQAADFLEITDLLKPAAQLWLDERLREMEGIWPVKYDYHGEKFEIFGGATNKQKILEEIKKTLTKHIDTGKLSKVFLTYVEDYLNSLQK